MKKAAKHKKELKKTLAFYKLHYAFKPPFNVIADAEFLIACSRAGIDPRREILLELDEQMTPIVTPEILRDLRERKEWAAVDHAKTFFYMKDKQMYIERENTVLIATERWDRALTPPAESVKRRIGSDNESRYIVATNDPLLRRELGNVPGVPLLHVDEDRKYVFFGCGLIKQYNTGKSIWSQQEPLRNRQCRQTPLHGN